MVKGLNHVALSVADLDRAVEFYCSGLGMQVVEREPFEGAQYDTILGLDAAKGRVALLRVGSFQIEIFEFASPKPVPAPPARPVCDHGITHFCLDVDAIEALCERLRRAGAAFHCDPLHFPGAGRATYVRDPEGNVFELFQAEVASPGVEQ